MREDAFGHRVSEMHTWLITLWTPGVSQTVARLIHTLIQILSMTKNQKGDGSLLRLIRKHCYFVIAVEQQTLWLELWREPLLNERCFWGDFLSNKKIEKWFNVCSHASPNFSPTAGLSNIYIGTLVPLNKIDPGLNKQENPKKIEKQ